LSASAFTLLHFLYHFSFSFFAGSFCILLNYKNEPLFPIFVG